jgi:hypothetical protein
MASRASHIRIVKRILLPVGISLLGVSCSSGGGGGTTNPTPNVPTVASVSVSPAAQSIVAGTTVQLSATPKTASGSAVSGQTISWSSGSPAIASVSAAGLVSGVTAGGPVTISAITGGVTGTASITVTAAPVATVYDAVNNISWLADADLAATNRFGLPLCSGPAGQACVNASGSMRWDAAVAWVAAMNAANYGGHSTWQLPTTPTIDNNCGRKGPSGNSFGFGCTLSALATLYNGLGLRAPNTAVPIPINTVGPFSNVQPYLYWSQSSGPPPSGNYTFSFATGWQGANTLPNYLYALPMIAGKLPGTPAASGTGLQVNPGGQTVYDPMTNITWLANANLAATNKFSLPVCTDPLTPALCVASSGAMTYASAAQFITNMNTAIYLGQANWQLPTIDSSCPGYNCGGALNPMGNLFYTQLALSQGMSAVPPSSIAVGAFHNLQPYLYWTCGAATIQGACDAAGPAPNFQWSFSFGGGFQGTDLLQNDLYVTVYFVGH